MQVAHRLHAAIRPLPANVRGACWIFVAGVAFTSMMILVKYLGADYAAATQSLFRQGVGLLVLLPAALRRDRTVFLTPTPWLLLFNGTIGATALTLGFLSYQTLPLAEANSLSYTRMLWLVPLATVVAGEPIRLPRLLATILGFGGVIVMMRPNRVGMDPGHVAALVAALLSGVSIITLKILTRRNGPLTMMIWSSTIGVLISLPLALIHWRWPGPLDLVLLLGMGLLGVVVQICYIRGLQTGEAAAVTPVDYSRLVLAAGAGWLLFGELPGAATAVGGAIVVGATLFISWQELRVSRRLASVAAAPSPEAFPPR